jgi:hypothetical protein
MPKLIAQKTRMVFAIFAIALYAFGAILGPAAASAPGHSSQPCHLTMQQAGGETTAGKHGATGAFRHGGQDCQALCSMAVMSAAPPALTQPTHFSVSFHALALSAEDFRPEQLSPPPKTLA